MQTSLPFPPSRPQVINPTLCATTAFAPTASSAAASGAYGQVRSSSFHVQFPLQPLLSCAAPSIVEGEDRNFLYHQQIHLKFPPPTMSPSTAFVVIAVTV
ncbi:hypothetical protein BHM03_00024335 [Ensete ventricosum]|nr:hypothetical protein BHM03_00024335 [Ensete ventricosum]